MDILDKSEAKMDKDPIREEVEKEACKLVHKYSIYEREDGSGDLSGNSDSMKSDLSGIIEKHLREKVELNNHIEEMYKCLGYTKERCEQVGDSPMDVINELNKELTALRSHNLELIEALNKIHNMPISSGFGDEQRIAQKALSSPSSEKYLKMVEAVDVLEYILEQDGLRDTENYGYLLPQWCKRKIEQFLKSYNSEKGGEHERE